MYPFFRRQATSEASDPTAPDVREEDSTPKGLTSEEGTVQSFNSTDKKSILRNLFQSDAMITVPNNTAVDIPRHDGKRAVRLYAQSLTGEDSLTESTNSSYCSVSEVISYSWEHKANVNVLALHRTKPLVAYVINTVYHKAFMTGKAVTAKPEDQMLRLVNHENQSRALCKPISEAPIADVAFSFDSPKRENSDLIVTIDQSGLINLMSFSAQTFASAPPQLSLWRVMTIRSSPDIVYPAERMCLSWCMFIPSESEEEEQPVDPTLRLAVTTGTNVEVFSFNDYHVRAQDKVVHRSDFKSNLGEYYVAHNVHQKEIVSVAVSNDGSLVCTASLANVLVFNNVDDTAIRMSYLREWKPQLADGEVVVFSSFLDDIDFLLSHPDQTFWGYLFVATDNGNMYIYDLQDKEWKLVQHLSIVYDDGASAGSVFSYRMDMSAKVILAVKERSLFVFLMEFSEENVRVPRIRQVARHQLYSEVISMQVKQTSDHEIDIFWVTLKNLERCRIDVTKMNESKLVSKEPKREVTGATASPLSKVFRRELPSPMVTSPKEQELLNKLQEKSNELLSMKKKKDPNSTITSSQVSYTSPVVAKRAEASAAVSSVPDSPQIHSLFGKFLVNGQQHGSRTNVPPPAPINAVASVAPPALNDMAKIMLIEDKLKMFESRFTKSFETLTAGIGSNFAQMQTQISQLKAEVQQPSASKQAIDRNVIELTINKVVEKSMKQMNVIVSKGLRDFFEQTDVGLGELQTKVTNTSVELKNAYDETKEQVSAVHSQMDIFVKQLERLDAQQQLLLFRYQQLIDQQ